MATAPKDTKAGDDAAKDDAPKAATLAAVNADDEPQTDEEAAKEAEAKAEATKKASEELAEEQAGMSPEEKAASNLTIAGEHAEGIAEAASAEAPEPEEDERQPVASAGAAAKTGQELVEEYGEDVPEELKGLTATQLQARLDSTVSPANVGGPVIHPEPK